MPPNQQNADDTTGRTLDHYNRGAEEFREFTRDHDVSQNINALLAAIEGAPPFRILDLGCGPGRDLVAFTRLGHVAVGLEGAGPLAAMAREASGCAVWQQNFLTLDLPQGQFDGIFANASLFHVPGAILPRVLHELFDALLPNGVLFCSNPRAFDADSEGWHGDRYGSYLTIDSWTRVICSAGLVLEHRFLRPSGKPAREQPWLAMVCRRPKAR
jgi:SAM-dependent methyltransferase